MRISFIVANIDLFHFLVNPHFTHALFVAHVVRLIYEDHWRALFQFVIKSSNIISLYLIFAFINHVYCKTLTL
ncbi:hypothetical protein HanXRQr2_Chr03g0089251 [Helianthus annuus]|uniref:Uncharacterized protein n=1 Tax=Helianthus annuus TaxID=4232 RepID=A0A9K3JBV3_HELAN|nr:hypothetical protein HanXRQr2_Chr03g0089251 [Helianthus annuus]KAJ0941924.1 hypothetical protein HanPSC8_Chr03g0085811 [Helianthus annuus]